MRKNSVKNTRINSEVTKALSGIIRDLKDPRISPMTSVMRAQVTPDLKFCKVFISVLGDEAARSDTMQGLKSGSGFIRNQLARMLNMRNTPELIFVEDQSIEYGVRMTKMIEDVSERDRAAQAMRPAEDGDDGEHEPETPETEEETDE